MRKGNEWDDVFGRNTCVFLTHSLSMGFDFVNCKQNFTFTPLFQHPFHFDPILSSIFDKYYLGIITIYCSFFSKIKFLQNSVIVLGKKCHIFHLSEKFQEYSQPESLLCQSAWKCRRNSELATAIKFQEFVRNGKPLFSRRVL